MHINLPLSIDVHHLSKIHKMLTVEENKKSNWPLTFEIKLNKEENIPIIPTEFQDTPTMLAILHKIKDILQGEMK